MKVSELQTKLEPKLGEGIYLTIDVSRILKLPYSKVKHAMRHFWHGYTFGSKGNRAINFFALIEFYTFYKLKDIGYTSAQIKKLHTKLAHDLNTAYPFASVRMHTPKNNDENREPGLRKLKRQIWYEYMGNLMRGDRSNQPTIESFVKPFLRQIEFGEDQIAKRFYPMGRAKNVVVDPLHQFGQPVIGGTNLQTKAIYNLYDAGEKKNNISKIYDISDAEVNDAIRYHKRKVA